MSKIELILEENKYIEQYSKAIFKLMNNSDISDYEYPLINLIHQRIEIELKYLIAESYYNEKTYKNLKINNTHNLDELVERDELKKYYDKIEELEIIFKEYREIVHYFGNILGENTFLNSRYSIETFDNRITRKEKINHNELYKKWTRFSELSGILNIIYVAYSFSNTIIHYKKQGTLEEELKKTQDYMVKSVIENGDIKSYNLIYNLINKFVTRNEYYDEKYINWLL